MISSRGKAGRWMPSVPSTLSEALDPAWLSSALGRRSPGVRVVSVVPGPVVARVSVNARFAVEYEGTGPPGLPRDLCVKGYFADYSEESAAARTAGVPEAMFYDRLAAGSGVRTLSCYYADVDPGTQHGVIITGDVAATGATFLDALSPYNADQVADSLEQYAILHGRTWGSTTLGHAWLGPRLAMTMAARGRREISGNFEGPIGEGVPEDVRDPELLLRAVGGLARHLDVADVRCLLHGDAHVGNLYLDAAERACLVDWQLVQGGPWYLDVGYHLGCTLDPVERRRSEADLLAHYLDRLRGEGVDPPTDDDLRRGIALGALYGFFLWSITLKVAPPVTTAMLGRLGSAVSDHEAYAAAAGL
jgi:Phosphotransferase enzyme family